MTKAKSKAVILLKSAVSDLPSESPRFVTTMTYCSDALTQLARITLTPHTLAFFLLSVIHCLAQGLTATFIYSEDASTFAFVSSVLRTADVPRNEVARLFRSGDKLVLKMCTAAPIGNVYKDCTTIWDTGTALNATEDVAARFIEERDTGVPLTLSRRSPEDALLHPIRNPANGTVTAVALTFNGGDTTVVLSETCARMLKYPGRILDNSRREDLALVGSQFWLLGISTFGILYNSIPHIWAVVFARVMQTVWAAYTVWRTLDVRFRYDTLIVGSGTPCHFDIMPAYFTTRLALQVITIAADCAIRAYIDRDSDQIPELVLNVTALVSTSFLAWHIVKACGQDPYPYIRGIQLNSPSQGYSSSTIRRVGPPPRVMRIYKFFLVDSMFLQLALFFTVTASSLWVDQLRNSEIAVLAQHSPLYYTLFIFTIVTIGPWIVMGWFAVRREMKLLMAGFLFLNVCYIVGWSVMFYSEVYRWTFIEWPFFGAATLVSFLVMVGALVFGIICWTGFGKGLAHYLHVEAVLTDSDFDPDVFTNDAEKSSTSRVTSPVVQCPNALSDPSREGVSTIKKDENWDFADVNRPPIYTVDFRDTRKGSTGVLPR
ncbi:hypothetical protein BN946_scf184999.g70 [Trametes cinnabarina]|uniref:Uncharacterized protein n=1 Tax=Pycnoporus cinnabarinus TaxID=5643 RepID=A0A060SDT3_PYCCI|nr:hypothetical protein BN946_scf184999.g70 [Trametes cinnabarina]